jgi:hypothetical protein
VVLEPFDSTMETIRRNMQFQEGRYDRMHILEKGRNQNQYSEEKRRTERLDEEEDLHWIEQHYNEERRGARRYEKDHHYNEERRGGRRYEEDSHWREQQHCYDVRRKEVPAGRESRNFQEKEVLENNRSRPSYFEDRRRHARQNEDEDQYWYSMQNHQEMRRFGKDYVEDQYWYGQQNHQERRRFSRDYEEVQRQDHQMDLHRFDGQNLSAWMFKIHQCFNYYGTPDDYHRYMFASYHMEGKALAWLVEMERKGVFTVDTEWNNFVRLINSRFGHHHEIEQKLKNYQNQRESLTESIKKLFERSDKGRKGEQAAKEYEDEIPEGREMDFQEPEEEQKSVEQKEIKDFQEPEILQKGRIILSKERRTIEQLEVCGEGIQEEKNGQIKNDEFLEPSPKIENMELKKVHPILEHGDGGLDLSKEVESRKFENPSLAFKDTTIIVPHQPFDEIPQPIQVKLLESEPIPPSTQPLKIQKNDLIYGLSGNGSGSMGFSDIGLRSISAKRKKRKLGINVHLGLEYTGEDGEEKGFLNLGFEKRLAKRGIGSWIFDPGKKSFDIENRNHSWNQELIRCQGTKEKIVMHILSPFVFQYLTENGMIFVMWKHRWRWKFFTFVSTTGFTISSTE